MKTFSETLIRLRKQKDMTQDAVAERLHVTRQTVSSWERGLNEPDMETLVALAVVFEVEVSELLGQQKIQNDPQNPKRQIRRCIVCASAVAAAILLQMFLLPVLRDLTNRTYVNYAFAFRQTVPSLGFLAGGMLLPGLIRLFRPLRIGRWGRWILLAAGILLGLPALLMGLDALCTLVDPAFSVFAPKFIIHIWFYDAGRCILMQIFPFLSGAMLFLSRSK